MVINVVSAHLFIMLEAIVSAYDIFFNSNIEETVHHTICSKIRSEQTISTYNLISSLSLCKEKHYRIENYYEEIIGKYLEIDFYRHFRMTPNSFEKLLHLIERKHEHCIKIFCGGFVPVCTEKCLLITLWYLGKGDSILSISDRFNLTESKIHSIIEEYVSYLVSLADDIIKWPNDIEKEIIEAEYASNKGYPGVIGAIDGCHISCVVPRNNHSSYVNRKTLHTIILQGTCNPKKMFTHIYVGFPGSAHDSRVLANSSLVMDSNLEKLFSNFKYHLLGDSAYPLKQWLMTPYRDTGKLTRAQKKYNYAHSSTRVKIENAFGILKGRWRILHFVNVYSIKKVINITVACCVLHNFCLNINDEWDDLYEEVDDDETDTGHDFSKPDQAAVTKRVNITEHLSLL